MNALDRLEDTNLFLVQTLDDLPEREWDDPKVNGNWSVKDLLSHLIGYHRALLDVLHYMLEGGPTPYVDRWREKGEDAFNAEEVESRGGLTAQQVLKEYDTVQAEAELLLEQIPVEQWTQEKDFPWPGPERTLDEAIKSIADHTRAHCEQIRAFRKRIHE